MSSTVRPHRRFRALLTVIFAFVCVGVCGAEEVNDAPPWYTEKVFTTPDLTQTDPQADLPGGGRMYCVPVATSNALMELARRGYSELLPAPDPSFSAHAELARLLGSKGYMNTGVDEGTGPAGMLRGLKKYLRRCGCEFELRYQGWRPAPREFATGVRRADMQWIKAGLVGSSAVLLNVGWYRHHPGRDEYERIGGHQLTLVGYGVDRAGRPDSGMLIVKDPSPRAGSPGHNEYVQAVELTSGRLVGKYAGLPTSAKGLFKMTGGMHLREGADCAILDYAVVLRLTSERRPPPPIIHTLHPAE